MKRLLIPIFIATALSGCAVVPYDQPYGVYSSAPVYSQQSTYPQAYPVDPVYVAPAPVYAAPVYVGPPVYFGFGLNFRSGGGHHHHHRRGYGRGYGGWRR